MSASSEPTSKTSEKMQLNINIGTRIPASPTECGATIQTTKQHSPTSIEKDHEERVSADEASSLASAAASGSSASSASVSRKHNNLAKGTMEKTKVASSTSVKTGGKRKQSVQQKKPSKKKAREAQEHKVGFGDEPEDYDSFSASFDEKKDWHKMSKGSYRTKRKSTGQGGTHAMNQGSTATSSSSLESQNIVVKEKIHSPDLALRSEMTTVEGQLRVNPQLTYDEALEAARREYNRRNAARARLRSKHLFRDLQEKCSELSKKIERLTRENTSLKAELSSLRKQKTSDLSGMPPRPLLTPSSMLDTVEPNTRQLTLSGLGQLHTASNSFSSLQDDLQYRESLARLLGASSQAQPLLIPQELSRASGFLTHGSLTASQTTGGAMATSAAPSGTNTTGNLLLQNYNNSNIRGVMGNLIQPSYHQSPPNQTSVPPAILELLLQRSDGRSEQVIGAAPPPQTSGLRGQSTAPVTDVFSALVASLQNRGSHPS